MKSRQIRLSFEIIVGNQLLFFFNQNEWTSAASPLAHGVTRNLPLDRPRPSTLIFLINWRPPTVYRPVEQLNAFQNITHYSYTYTYILIYLCEHLIYIHINLQYNCKN